MRRILTDARSLPCPRGFRARIPASTRVESVIANEGYRGECDPFIQIMLRKFIARLRESIAPAKVPTKKPAPAAAALSAPRPQGGQAPRRQGQPSGNRPHAQGARPQGHSQGQSPQGHGQPRPQESRPKQDDRRPAGRGPVRSGFGQGRRGDGPKPRPARDDFEHPGRTTAKPLVPVDVPKMDTPFPSSGLWIPLPMRSSRRVTRSRLPSRARRSRSYSRDAMSSGQRRQAPERPRPSHSPSSRGWASTARCAA